MIVSKWNKLIFEQSTHFLLNSSAPYVHWNIRRQLLAMHVIQTQNSRYSYIQYKIQQGHLTYLCIWNDSGR